MSRDKELSLIEPGQGALQPAQVKHQMALIKDLMKDVLVEGTHWGKIPGCGDKPALFQPGGQKLGLMFNLGAKYVVNRIDLDHDHREYGVTCELIHRTSGRTIGQGLGACSTLESKYRYRWDDTGDPVPGEYWNQGRPQALLGGENYVARKAWVGNGNQRKQVWHIFLRVEHNDPADYYNTVLKIGKKRAFLDAILTATAAGDIFMPDDETDPEAMQNTQGMAEDQPGRTIEQPKAKAQASGERVTEGQARMLVAKLKNGNVAFVDFNQAFGVNDCEELPRERMNEALEWIASRAGS